MPNGGYIALHRKILDWEWYKNSSVKDVFIHLLLNANHESGKWQGVQINRGQLITGRKELAKNLDISEQTVRTALTKLKSTNEITIKSTNKFSLITIVNYDIYQVPSTSRLTNKSLNEQPTTNQQLTTNNKDNKNNKEREHTQVLENRFNKRESITPQVISEISKQYQVPTSTVEDCWDSAKNWLDAKGKVQQNYKAFLSNWVKRESAREKLMQKTKFAQPVRVVSKNEDIYDSFGNLKGIK